MPESVADGKGMATLELLKICGIRSFSPQQFQDLQFINPVTLIHGPNGTGKTVEYRMQSFGLVCLPPVLICVFSYASSSRQSFTSVNGPD